MRVGSRTVASVAIAGAAALGVTPVLAPGLVAGTQRLWADVALLADEGWILGGTGLPVPDPGYLNAILGLYLQPNPPLFAGQSTFDSYSFQGLTTPESFCPPVCFPGPPGHPEWTNLNAGDSMNIGAQILDDSIRPQLEAGDNVTVFGFSQSAVVATMEMQNLINNAPGGSYDPDNLNLVMIGAPNSPIGGILDRFVFPDGIGPFFSSIPQHVPFLNIPLGIGASPLDTFATDIYTGAYDGWANFPRDVSNIGAVINALIGIGTVHPFYPFPAPEANLDIDNIVNLGTLGSTDFHMIPAPLPLLAFMYIGGPAGRIFYDMFAPGMALNINWAYGNPGDPFVGVNGTDAIGPWQVNASGELVESGVAGFLLKMDPLQMLAGMQWAGVQSFINPLTDILNLIYGGPLPPEVATFMSDLEDSMLTGYNLTNQLDQALLSAWTDLATQFNVLDTLGPDAVFDGSPLISAEPLLDLVGWGFNIFNLFGA